VCRSFTKILPISTWYTEPAAAASVPKRRAEARLRAGDLWRQEVRRRGRRAVERGAEEQPGRGHREAEQGTVVRHG
jgi:hypothetical protein